MEFIEFVCDAGVLIGLTAAKVEETTHPDTIADGAGVNVVELAVMGGNFAGVIVAFIEGNSCRGIDGDDVVDLIEATFMQGLFNISCTCFTVKVDGAGEEG